MSADAKIFSSQCQTQLSIQTYVKQLYFGKNANIGVTGSGGYLRNTSASVVRITLQTVMYQDPMTGALTDATGMIYISTDVHTNRSTYQRRHKKLLTQP